MKVNEVIVEDIKTRAIVSKVADTAYKDFIAKLRKNNVNLSKINSADGNLSATLKQYVFNYMVSGDSGKLAQRIAVGLETVPLPAQLTTNSIKQYIKDAAMARQKAKEEIANELPGMGTSPGIKKPDGSYCEIDGPEADISKCIDSPYTQYRFMHPEYPGVEVIIRQTGYYYKQLPAAFRGLVKKDKATGLYPVLRKDNIQKLNTAYNSAADAGRVKEEPVSAL